MKLKFESVEAFTIYDTSKLDPILVVTQNHDAGSGTIVVTCYGCAWTAWFGGMGDSLIADFVSGVDADYLAGKLHATMGKFTTREKAYLTRIAQAVIDGMRLRVGVIEKQATDAGATP